MSLFVPLPDVLPAAGFAVDVVLQRIPEASFVVKATLNPRADRPVEPVSIYVYGRGQDADAWEKTHLVAHFDAETVRRGAAPQGNQLMLVVEDLSGRPVDEAALQIEAVTVQ